jgi:hypothetical protein
MQNEDDAGTDRARLVRPGHSHIRMPRLRLCSRDRASRSDEIPGDNRLAPKRIAVANVRPPRSAASCAAEASAWAALVAAQIRTAWIAGFILHVPADDSATARTKVTRRKTTPQLAGMRAGALPSPGDLGGNIAVRENPAIRTGFLIVLICQHCPNQDRTRFRLPRKLKLPVSLIGPVVVRPPKPALRDGLAVWANEVRERANTLPPGPERDARPTKASPADTAANGPTRAVCNRQSEGTSSLALPPFSEHMERMCTFALIVRLFRSEGGKT